MANAKSGDTVQVHYTGKLEDGSVFDSSREKDPLEFQLGAGNMIPGFEKAVQGMEVGDSKTVDIPSNEAYGDHNAEMMLEVPRQDVPEDINPEEGQQLAVKRQDGSSMPVVVAQVTEEKVVLDANHPLAGKDLTFDIELMSIK